MCLEIYEIDLARFIAAPGLAWESASKNIKVKLDLLTDIDMLLIVEKGIRRGICHSIYWYIKVNYKRMEEIDENREPSYFQYWDLNHLYRWAISLKFPVNNFKWVKDISKFIESFRKSYNEESHKGYFLKGGFQYPKKLNERHNDLPILPDRMKIQSFESCH